MSKKVFVVATAIMKTAMIKGDVNDNNNGEILSRPIVTVFGCNPGNNPVRIPKIIPMIIAIVIVINKITPYFILLFVELLSPICFYIL